MHAFYVLMYIGLHIRLQMEEEITIFADVSKNKEFQFRYPMYIHLSNDGESYKSYQMKLDYLQKSSTWAYSFIIDSTTFFK